LSERQSKVKYLFVFCPNLLLHILGDALFMRRAGFVNISGLLISLDFAGLVA